MDDQESRQLCIEKARTILNHRGFLAKTPSEQKLLLDTLVARGLHPDDLAALQGRTNLTVNLTSIVGDPFFLVIKDLPSKDVAALCSTNVKFRQFCTRKGLQLWRYLLDRDFPLRARRTTTFIKNLYENNPAELYKLISRPAQIFEIRTDMIRNFYSQYSSKDVFERTLNLAPYIVKSIITTMTERLEAALKSIIDDSDIFRGDYIYLAWLGSVFAWDGEHLHPLLLSRDTDKYVKLSAPFQSFPEFPLDHFTINNPFNAKQTRLSEKSVDEAMQTYDPLTKQFTVSDKFNTYNIDVRETRDPVYKGEFTRIVSQHRDRLYVRRDEQGQWYVVLFRDAK